MIRDRIVLGTKDKGVRGRLLRESTLTLNGAVEMFRTIERTSCQLKKLQGHSETDYTDMAQVNYAARGSKKHTRSNTAENDFIKASKQEISQMQIRATLSRRHMANNGLQKSP